MSRRDISVMVQRVLGVLMCVGEAGISGMRSGEIAAARGVRADQVTRCIANLVEAGLVEEHVECAGVYRVSPRVGRIAAAVMRDVHYSRERLDEVEKRYLGN